MTSFRLISVAAAALLFAQLHEAAGAQATKNKSSGLNCLATMNKERDAVGFTHFKQETDAEKKLPLTATGMQQEVQAKIDAICDAIVNHDNPKAVLFEPKEQSWTFGYAPEFGADPDCSNAITFWKTARGPFEGLPPPYKSDAIAPYDWYTTRSFIALFNPQPNPTVDCAFFECPYKVDEIRKKLGVPKPDASQAGAPKQPATAILTGECKGRKDCLLAKGEGVLKSVVCVTFPPPLVKDKAPYTKDQWDKITKHVGAANMYSVTAATSFVLAASALWVASF